MVVYLAGSAVPLAAQETDAPAPGADTVPAPADSTTGEAELERVSTQVQEVQPDSVGPTPPVSPMGAFFRSLVLPGWGQVSVDQPGRGAFYFAMEAASLWMLLKTTSRLEAAKRTEPLNEELIETREGQVEDWAALTVFWALFAGVDAWVSAQLWDFTGEVVPPPDGSPGVAFQYSVPVGP